MLESDVAAVVEVGVATLREAFVTFGIFAGSVTAWRAMFSRAKDVRKENLKLDLEIRRLMEEQVWGPAADAAEGCEKATPEQTGLDKRIAEELDSIYNTQHKVDWRGQREMNILTVAFAAGAAMVNYGFKENIYSAVTGFVLMGAVLWWIKKRIVG